MNLTKRSYLVLLYSIPIFILLSTGIYYSIKSQQHCQYEQVDQTDTNLIRRSSTIDNFDQFQQFACSQTILIIANISVLPIVYLFFKEGIFDLANLNQANTWFILCIIFCLSSMLLKIIQSIAVLSLQATLVYQELILINVLIAMIILHVTVIQMSTMNNNSTIQLIQELCDEVRKKADINMMKVIHDLKNPIQAIQEIINDTDEDKTEEEFQKKPNKWIRQMSLDPNDINEGYDKSKICQPCKNILRLLQSDINSEILDLSEMLENLKTSFKIGHSMDIVEEKVKVTTQEIVQSICKTHKKLAINGFNKYSVKVEEFFPNHLCIQKTLFKRVVNNIISNSLKHTQCGQVELLFDQTSQVDDICNKYFNSEQIHVGSDLNLNENYLQVKIKDNGSGIPTNKIKLIFGDQQSDQSKMNWDGTGLGLPICASIIQKAGGFIRQWSVENQGTQFCIFQPHPLVKNNSDTYYQQTELKIITNPFLNNTLHACNEVIIAEDNNSILKKQEKIQSKNKIPFQSFSNGRACLEYINQLDCDKCSKSLILTDQMMPFMTGNEMTIQIRKRVSSREQIVALITAEDEEINAKYNHIFDQIEPKPITAIKLKDLHKNTYGTSGEQIQSDKVLKNIKEIINPEDSKLKSNQINMDIDKDALKTGIEMDNDEKKLINY